jgi:hypothetical protein
MTKKSAMGKKQREEAKKREEKAKAEAERKRQRRQVCTSFCTVTVFPFQLPPNNYFLPSAPSEGSLHYSTRLSTRHQLFLSLSSGAAVMEEGRGSLTLPPGELMGVLSVR